MVFVGSVSGEFNFLKSSSNRRAVGVPILHKKEVATSAIAYFISFWLVSLNSGFVISCSLIHQQRKSSSWYSSWSISGAAGIE